MHRLVKGDVLPSAVATDAPKLALPAGLRRLVEALRAAGGRPYVVGGAVRDFARELRVNPATVSKAYQRLTEQGVLEVRRGEGTFVSGSPPALGRAERARLVRDGAARYASLGLTLGASREEALDELRGAWTELGRRGKGEER